MTAADDLADRLITVPRAAVVRRIAALILNDTHWLVASCPAHIARDTADRLGAIPATIYATDDLSVDAVVLPAPFGTDNVIRAGLEALPFRSYTITAVAKDATAAADLAAALDAQLDPAGALPLTYRRPTDFPDTPPRLLREAWARLAAHQGRRHR